MLQKAFGLKTFLDRSIQKHERSFVAIVRSFLTWIIMPALLQTPVTESQCGATSISSSSSNNNLTLDMYAALTSKRMLTMQAATTDGRQSCHDQWAQCALLCNRSLTALKIWATNITTTTTVLMMMVIIGTPAAPFSIFLLLRLSPLSFQWPPQPPPPPPHNR